MGLYKVPDDDDGPDEQSSFGFFNGYVSSANEQ
jgi:hypothetical protein